MQFSNFHLAFESPFLGVWLIFWAFVLDRVMGDPKKIPHPVVLIGVIIAGLDSMLNRGGALLRRLGGIVLVLLVVPGTYFATWGILYLLTKLSPWLGLAGSLWLMAATLASKSLAQAANEIYRLLMAKDLLGARRKLAWIVGRDTMNLPEGEVVRGTVETVAENIVDGVTSPLFYALIGGVPLAMAYKAVNTLDSMVGYRNDKYLAFGWAGARLDDVLNFIPARVTALLLVGVAWSKRFDWQGALSTIRKDAAKHPSPNSGYPEGAVAGALGVRLGGWNSYGGVKSLRAYMGTEQEKLRPEHITRTVKLMFATGWVFLTLGLLVKLLIILNWWR